MIDCFNLEQDEVSVYFLPLFISLAGLPIGR